MQDKCTLILELGVRSLNIDKVTDYSQVETTTNGKCFRKQ